MSSKTIRVYKKSNTNRRGEIILSSKYFAVRLKKAELEIIVFTRYEQVMYASYSGNTKNALNVRDHSLISLKKIFFFFSHEERKRV